MSDALQGLAKAAAEACGRLVQALKVIPGVNTAAIDQSAAHLRSDLVHLVNSAHPSGQQGNPQAQSSPGGMPMPPESVMQPQPVKAPPMP